MIAKFEEHLDLADPRGDDAAVVAEGSGVELECGFELTEAEGFIGVAKIIFRGAFGGSKIYVC
jgi:hypothetical protein